MLKEIRQPIQQRSIETKRKIILAGYELFAKNGYFKTNTAQIAKQAQVSTGIVYGYFNNKKDILNEVIDLYIKNVYDPIFELLDDLGNKEDIKTLILRILSLAEELHKKSIDIHRELNAVAMLNENVNSTFVSLQDKVTLQFADKLKKLGYENISNENIHISMNLIESFIHELVYDKHEYLNYEALKDQVINLIASLFLKN